MSSLSALLSRERANSGTLYFYREGVFYKAYEQSAYLFVKYVKPFQVKKRFVKSVKQEVVSIGFPTNSLYNYFSKEQVVEHDNEARVELDKKIDVGEFERWRADIPLMEELPHRIAMNITQGNSALLTATAPEKQVAMQVRMFPIEAKTPLDCMLFLSEIKKQLE